MQVIKIITFCIALIFTPAVWAGKLHIIVVEKAESEKPIEFAGVSLANENLHYGGLTDEEGQIWLEIPQGKWSVTISAVGYKKSNIEVALHGDMSVVVRLEPSINQIAEVVVTARESQGATSASIIDGAAMEHLQPSSFTDLMELLPGGVSKDPEMGSANIIKLRQADNIGVTDYNTSSLGTSFVVDGVPINTNAGMQFVSTNSENEERSVVGKGVDMRAISTDDIESVEVVRGIASVEYGELTSGLVNIKRKKGVSNLEARFKADMQSQLFYVGKGFAMPGDDWTINVSLDYLDSKVDPRNARENYKRLDGSLRSNKQWLYNGYMLTLNSAISYTGTFERDKNDPDLTINNTRDYYTSDNNSLSINNVFVLRRLKDGGFRSFTLTQGFSYAWERLRQEKTVATSRIYPLPISTEVGDNYVGYLPMLYDATMDVKGDPMTVFVKAQGLFRYDVGLVDNRLKFGGDWNMSKNYGEGRVYDPTRPISPDNTMRPRAFNDIPAMHQLSFYAENVSTINTGNHRFELMMGLRETQLLNLDKKYTLHGKTYWDPRINLLWQLPASDIVGYPIKWELAGGFGWHTKMPVAAYLYPDRYYLDYVQLNYFHNDEAYRTMNVRTYVEDMTNYELKAARNFKWELRGDVSYQGNRLSVTYFRENMTDGFRHSSIARQFAYNRYDATAYDPYVENRAPRLEDLPYETRYEHKVFDTMTNGSRTKKEGIEYTFSSMRFPVVRTRLTISGAWFRTTLDNSQPLWYKPTVILNGREMQYVGLYDDSDGRTYESFNTNFMFDTDVPSLKLNFSIAIQNMWYTKSRTHWKSGIPVAYMDIDGNVYPYTEESLSDPYLQHLVRNYTDGAFQERKIPVATNINFKATKKIWQDRIGIALYVNRLLSILPDYEYGGKIQRRYASPYFGMELNFKL